MEARDRLPNRDRLSSAYQALIGTGVSRFYCPRRVRCGGGVRAYYGWVRDKEKLGKGRGSDWGSGLSTSGYTVS